MPVLRRVVEHRSLQPFGHEFQIHEVTGIVVGISVAVGITELAHQLRGSVAKMERHSAGLVVSCNL